MTTDRLTLSQLLDKSPSSSGFYLLVLASRAYGLTTGGKNADSFGLTDIGRAAVSPDPTEQQDGFRRAVLSVEPFRRFLTAYDKKRVPLAAAFKAFLINQAGVPNDHAEQCMDQLLGDARLAGLLRTVKGAEYIDLQGVTPPAIASRAVDGEPHEDQERDGAEELDEALGEETGDGREKANGEHGPVLTTPQKVFITHGKDREIVNQLQELLKFGQFEPVVAQEHETVSKPVPDKVLEDMRECSAAVIHVATEQRLLDESGGEHHKINENVLVEIGAAMALYGRNFILLVPKGLHLPSNLQGLYRCEYEGDRLDYEATMKLLKAFNDFR